jgi:hypothetical protein
MFVSRSIHTRRKTVAAFLLLALTVQTVIPATAYALTSGPSQPEMKGFEPIGMSNMVDPFTGDFSYNIPLLDVDGYPVNLNYKAGSTPDDDASWVGFGWSLTPGVLNRQMRGLPDDFNGSDKIQKETNYKDHIVKGLTTTVRGEVIGIPKKGGSVSSSVSIGVEYDNYRGIGTKLGINAGFSIGDNSADENNQNNKETDVVLGDIPSGRTSFSLGLTSSSMNGATASVGFPILKKMIGQSENSVGVSIGFPYNSRTGLQGMSLGTSFSVSKMYDEEKYSRSYDLASTFISFAAPTYIPSIDVPTKSESISVSVSPGLQLGPIFAAVSFSGYRTRQYIDQADKKRSINSYGMLYADKGKDDDGALMDFNREKDIPYSKEVQYLPVPIPTADIFSASSQGDGGQYKISRNSHGIFFDPLTTTKGSDNSFGIEGGPGLLFDVGADYFHQSMSSSTNKWKKKNDFLQVGDFTKGNNINSLKEAAYFKRTGEPVAVDNAYYEKLGGDSAIAIPLRGDNDEIGTSARFRTKTGQTSISSQIERVQRETRNQPFSYLTAVEASIHGLDKNIKSYPANTLVLGNCNESSIQNITRTASYRKPHHISEVTVTAQDGKRTLYGIPVYNITQEETSFSVTGDTAYRRQGLVPYSGEPESAAAYSNSRDKYFSRQTTPAYATSYLLTGILSSDYMDVKGDGITDDDMGEAVKFNYSMLPTAYKWRTPYRGTTAGFDNHANYNEGFLSDQLDDKGNYTYGEREVWYMHSIESKTMVALFISEDRDDGLGVTGNSGWKNTTNKLKRLKEIRLYSRSDAKANNNDLSKMTPVKIVHFEYTYSLMKGIPNGSGGGGKLTLKKIYFTYGNSETGSLHPYTFEYNTDSVFIGNNFNHKQYDRWGTYKDPNANPSGMTNAEFPYTLQNTQTDEFVARWQLKKINLPTGGSISVDYESDDYAYVQNRRAMQMLGVSGVGSGGSSGSASGLVGADEVFVDLPVSVNNASEFSYRYLNGQQYLFFKFFVDLDNKGHYEFVPGYAKINSVRLVNNSRVAIKLEKEDVEGVGLTNPISHTSWQFIKTNLPKYAYPGYENLESESSDLVKAVQSLATAVSNLQELIPNSYPKIAKRRNYGNTFIPSKSFVRLQSPAFNKKGGGLRVKRVSISDEWENISGVSGSKTAVYKQEYNYTTTIKDQNGDDLTISSGVAAYEPLLGGEENPFRQPIFYKQNVILQLDNFYYIEEPFCEGLYPAPNVGYSRVSVKSIGSGESESKTGEVVNEFYTAKDYPTKVDILSMEKSKYGSSKLMNLIVGKITQRVGLSQGYKIENNDMHGKPKAVSIYNVSKTKISSTEYFYKTVNPNEENSTLDNRVKLLMPNGTVTDGMIGKDMEVFSDMRESISTNEGTKIQVSGGAFLAFILPVPFLFPGVGANYDKRSYQSSSTIKTINRFAILDKVRKMENGSYLTTENLLWNGLNGDVVMTKTQNEFDDPVYNLTLPADWAYNGMGQAYQNEGTYLAGLTTNSTGEIVSGTFSQFLSPGDEIVSLLTDDLMSLPGPFIPGSGFSKYRYWVIYTNGTYRLIDRNGAPAIMKNILYAKIVRSGRRNMLSAPMCSFVSLKNPIVGDRLSISSDLKLLTMNAAEYSEEWNVPKPVCLTCPEGYTLSADGLNCYQDIVANTCSTVCQGSQNSSYTSEATWVYNAGYDINGGGVGASGWVSDTYPPYSTFWLQGNCGLCPGGSAQISMNELTEGSSVSRQTTLPKYSVAPALLSPSESMLALTKQPSPAQVHDSLQQQKTAAQNAVSSKILKDDLLTSGKQSNFAEIDNSSAITMQSSLSLADNACGLTAGPRDYSFCSPLNRTAIWTCQGNDTSGSRGPVGVWVGFTRTIHFNSTKTYYIGLAADNCYRLKIDGATILQRLSPINDNFKVWHIYPVTLTAGDHTIEMEAKNETGPAAMGLEVYNNTPDEILYCRNYCNLNLLFSTKDMIGQTFSSGVSSCPTGYNLTDTGSGPFCRASVPSSYSYNPYMAGHLGNWRAKKDYAFQTTRETVQGNPNAERSTNIRKAGAYKAAIPFWTYNNSNQQWEKTGLSDSRWVGKNESIAYNRKGNGIEEKDPLNRYSSALYGYLDSKPVATAANARYGEIAYDGFEDQSFLTGCSSSSSGNCLYSHFDLSKTSATIDNTVSHSGNASLKLTTGISISKQTNTGAAYGAQYTINNTTGKYMLNSNISWSNGFTPVVGKKYLISLWVKDGSPRSATTSTAIKINGTAIINTTIKWPLVEGWKRIEIPFTIPSSSSVSLEIIPSGTTWIDDIRIMPFDAQMKSFAYDAISQRLMAEMDENNFATYYEYDSEGTLVRVKKETEKGIVTIKETRSSYRKQ